jgi:hypothetical protein
VIRTKGRHKRRPAAEKAYASACLAVEREFRRTRQLRPQVTLVLPLPRPRTDRHLEPLEPDDYGVLYPVCSANETGMFELILCCVA